MPVETTYNSPMSIRESPSTRSRSARVGARLAANEKARLQRAADLLGQSLSQFLLASARQAADDVISHHEVIVLSAEDSLIFANAIIDPPPPNERLRAAFADYERRVAQME
jgi:uncharacterized protein (DUF1778 family)